MLGCQASLDPAVPQFGACQPGDNLCQETQTHLESKATDMATALTNPTAPALTNPKSTVERSGPTCQALSLLPLLLTKSLAK